MKWTANDIAAKLYNYLKAEGVMGLSGRPNGRLFLNQRFANSQLEDVVINTGALQGDLLQEGDLTLNIYVKNPTLTKDGITDRTLPDIHRIKEVTNIFRPYVNEIWGPSWNYELIDVTTKAAEDDFHIAEMKLAFRGLYDGVDIPLPTMGDIKDLVFTYPPAFDNIVLFTSGAEHAGVYYLEATENIDSFTVKLDGIVTGVPFTLAGGELVTVTAQPTDESVIAKITFSTEV